MQRAPWVVGLLFGLSLAVLVTLLGLLALFNPWFTSTLQQRHAVAAAFDTTQPEIDRVTGSILLDLYVDGSFEVALNGDEPLLNGRERSHMHDVAILIRVLAAILILAFVLAGVTGTWLRAEPRRLGAIMMLAGGLIGSLALALAIVFAVAFEPAFLFFHEAFFRPGTYLFEPGSKLITLFPQGFWFDAALVAGGTILLSAAVVAVGGIALWRRRPPTPRPA